jgi:hypothetical protein
MHPESTTRRQDLDGLTAALEQLLGESCGFGICHEPATQVVITRSPIGHRVERLCDAHAQRRAELEETWTLDENVPIPFVLTDRGRADVARWRAEERAS